MLCPLEWGTIWVFPPPDDKWAGQYMDPSHWIDTKRLNDGWQMWRHTVVSPDDDWAQSPYWEGTPYYLMSNPAVRCYSDNTIKYASREQLQAEEKKHAERKANAKRKREEKAKQSKRSKTAAPKEKAAAPKEKTTPVEIKPAPKKRPMTNAMRASKKKASKATSTNTVVASSSSSSSSSSRVSSRSSTLRTPPF